MSSQWPREDVRAQLHQCHRKHEHHETQQHPSHRFRAGPPLLQHVFGPYWCFNLVAWFVVHMSKSHWLDHRQIEAWHPFHQEQSEDQEQIKNREQE